MRNMRTIRCALVHVRTQTIEASYAATSDSTVWAHSPNWVGGEQSTTHRLDTLVNICLVHSMWQRAAIAVNTHTIDDHTHPHTITSMESNVKVNAGSCVCQYGKCVIPKPNPLEPILYKHFPIHLHHYVRISGRTRASVSDTCWRWSDWIWLLRLCVDDRSSAFGCLFWTKLSVCYDLVKLKVRLPRTASIIGASECSLQCVHLGKITAEIDGHSVKPGAIKGE